MNKIWLLAVTTYRRQVRSFSFRLLTFGLPITFILIGVLASALEQGQNQVLIGYVDETRTLSPVQTVELHDLIISLREIEDQNAALDDFKRGVISGFLLIPEDYFKGEQTTFFGSEEPNTRMVSALAEFMRKGMNPDQPAWVYDRLEDPANITYIQASTGIAVAEGPPALMYFATPGILAILLVFAIFTGVTQMGTAAVSEKDERLLEIILSTMSNRQFIVGKVMGIAGLTLTQLSVWLLGVLLAIVIPALREASSDLNIRLPPTPFLWALALGIPCFLLYSMLAASAGIAAGDGRQAQQIAGSLTLIALAPIWLLPLIVDQPDGTAAILLSLFPLTGPIVSLGRMTLTDVPIWQLSMTFVLVLISLITAIAFTAWIMRAAFIMQGQSFFDRKAWQSAFSEMRPRRRE